MGLAVSRAFLPRNASLVKKKLPLRVLSHGVDDRVWDAEAEGSSPLHPTFVFGGFS